jgi:hypothetical protein
MLCLSIFSSCSICSLALLENGKIKMAKRGGDKSIKKDEKYGKANLT